MTRASAKASFSTTPAVNENSTSWVAENPKLAAAVSLPFGVLLVLDAQCLEMLTAPHLFLRLIL